MDSSEMTGAQGSMSLIQSDKCSKIFESARPFTCDWPGCKKNFSHNGSLKNHLLIHYNNQADKKKSRNKLRSYNCEYKNCSKVFRAPSLLAIHCRKHTGERPYKCEVQGCNKSFNQKGNWKNHKLTHTGEKNYVCDICGRKFSLKGNLATHINKIHKEKGLKSRSISDDSKGERPYACKVQKCKKTFFMKNSLKFHKLTHMDYHALRNDKIVVPKKALQHCCHYKNCNKIFPSRTKLNDHMRRHTGERPYICSFQNCGKEFYRIDHLKVHSMIHTGEKNFQCSVCGRRFTQKGHLIRHLKTCGIKEHLYACKKQNYKKKFTLKKNLKTIRLIHSEEKNTSDILAPAAFFREVDLAKYTKTHNKIVPMEIVDQDEPEVDPLEDSSCSASEVAEIDAEADYVSVETVDQDEPEVYSLEDSSCSVSEFAEIDAEADYVSVETVDQDEPEVDTLEDSSCSVSEITEIEVEEVNLVSDDSETESERPESETIWDQQQGHLYSDQLTELQSYESCKNQLQFLEQLWTSHF